MVYCWEVSNELLDFAKGSEFVGQPMKGGSIWGYVFVHPVHTACPVIYCRCGEEHTL